jgi:hypothetical protein
MKPEAPSPKEILRVARQHFRAGHRPIPLSWDPELGLRPLVRSYSDLFDKKMSKTAFEKFFLDRRGDLKSNIQGLGILVCKDTGIFGIDIDNKNGGPNGLKWFELRKLSVPMGMLVGTPHGDGMHIVQRWPDGVDQLPNKDLGNIIARSDDVKHKIGVELKGRQLFVVAGPGYERENDITAIMPADEELIELVVNSEPEWIEEGYYDADKVEEVSGELPELKDAIPRKGYLRDFVDHLTQTTIIAPEFALGVGLTQLSILMNGKLAVRDWSRKLVKSHIWTLLVAPPASGKSMSWEIGLENMLDEVTHGKLQIPADQTPESLLEFLGRAPHGYIFHTEFAGFMARSAGRAYQAGDKTDLANMYDSPHRYTRRTKTGGEVKVRNPSFTIAGGLTRSDFERYIKEEDMRSGFLTRFLFIMLENKPTGHHGLRDAVASDAERHKVTRALSTRWKLVNDIVKRQRGDDDIRSEAIEIELTDQAIYELDRYTRRIRELDVDSVLVGFQGRLGQYALKLGMCYALSRATREDEEFKVMGEDIRYAIRFLDYVRSRSWPVVLDVAGLQSNAARELWRFRNMIQQLMKRAAGTDEWKDQWVDSRTVFRHLHTTTRTFDTFLESLTEAGMVKTRTQYKDTTDKLGRRYTGKGRKEIILTRLGWISDLSS